MRLIAAQQGLEPVIGLSPAGVIAGGIKNTSLLPSFCAQSNETFRLALKIDDMNKPQISPGLEDNFPLNKIGAFTQEHGMAKSSSKIQEGNIANDGLQKSPTNSVVDEFMHGEMNQASATAESHVTQGSISIEESQANDRGTAPAVARHDGKNIDATNLAVLGQDVAQGQEKIPVRKKMTKEGVGSKPVLTTSSRDKNKSTDKSEDPNVTSQAKNTLSNVSLATSPVVEVPKTTPPPGNRIDSTKGIDVAADVSTKDHASSIVTANQDQKREHTAKEVQLEKNARIIDSPASADRAHSVEPSNSKQAESVGAQPLETLGGKQVFNTDTSRVAHLSVGSGELVQHVSANVSGKTNGSGFEQGHSTELAQPVAQANVENTTLKATPTTLEVGVAGGTHGWLKIRAEVNGDGAVTASLSSGSQAGQQMLHRELSSMAAFLKSESVHVDSLSVHNLASAASSSGLAAGSERGLGGERDQFSNRGEKRESWSASSPGGKSQSSGEDSSEVIGVPWVNLATSGTAGGWLNVMA